MKMTGDSTNYSAQDGTLYQKIEGYFEIAEHHVAAALRAGFKKVEEVIDELTGAHFGEDTVEGADGEDTVEGGQQ